MRATQHPSNNDVLLPPPGASNEECRPLAITRIVYECGTHAVRSFWQPTAAEIKAISAGAAVQLTMVGRTHPPVLIEVDGAA